MPEIKRMDTIRRYCFNFQENEVDYDGNSQLRVILTKNEGFFSFSFFCASAELLGRNFRVSLLTFVFIFSLIEELAYSVLKTSAYLSLY